MKIATLGPQGTYSESAVELLAQRYHSLNPEIIFTTINNALKLVQNKQVDFAVLPVENVIDGFIGSSFDALWEYGDWVKVYDEVHLPITHILAGKPGIDWAEVSKIYSHPSALNQCQHQLAEFFPKADLIALNSTAEAAQRVIHDADPNSAAVCNRKILKNQQLIAFGEKIQDYEYNETRFLVCSLQASQPTGNDRTLLAVRYGINRSGQLYQTAKHFADQGVDLTFVQSRPSKLKPQEYIIFFEFIGHQSDKNVEAALKAIELQVTQTNGWHKVLGSYPQIEREAIHQ